MQINCNKGEGHELIYRFEVTRRRPYSGGFGRISFLGDTEIALALSTMVFSTRACQLRQYIFV